MTKLKSTLIIGGILLLSLPVLMSCSSAGNQGEIKPPINVLVITADDLGLQLSSYGDSTISTPNLDRLAVSGIKFNNAYVTQASCSSSRSSILTGTYPHFNGQIGLAHRGFSMNRTLPNIASSLKQAGYKTGVIGKLHVEPKEQFPFDLDRSDQVHETRDVELVSEWVDEFITSSPDSSFFLYLNYFDPHTPLIRNIKGHPEQEVISEEVQAFAFQGVYDPGELERIADYYNCVKRLDEGIGLLMRKLEELDVLDNTLIVFVGDHGPPFSRGKAASYEYSVRIPFLVKYPEGMETIKESDELVSTIDIYPTILDALGIETPMEVQGQSLEPLVYGESNKVRNYLFTEYNFHTHFIDNYYPRRTVRDQRYKLIYNLPSGDFDNEDLYIDKDSAYYYSRGDKYEGTWVREVFDRLASPSKLELYDLDNDPFEKVNLIEKESLQSKKEELFEALQEWMEDTNDPFIDHQVMLGKRDSVRQFGKFYN
ncbi:sulfatase family protein [Echinicola salinicaeni]|uniref:sulfatase family protein n=1 Tax=Echinicola salinicaeni TaxID=2762757 RepID=UPI001648F3C7|nr:sulfatase [Echinicola salinicaeni]